MNTTDGTQTPSVLPSAGTLTFVLGDVVSSTRLWENHPDAMPAVLARLDALVDATLAARHGHRPPEQGEGDNFVAAFGNAADGVAFAADLAAGLSAETWPDGLEVTVRMAVHTGDARRRDGGRYMGEALNRCARLRALGHGGQVLVSGTTSALVVEHLAGGVFLRDLGAHQLRDLSQPERVAQLCGPGLPFDFPSLRSLDRTMTNLPVQITSFVGRAAELAETTLLLQDRRLLTLAGAGGCGKTRLAIQLAAEVLDDFADGVWFADLAPVADPDLVPNTLAAAAAVTEIPGQPVLDTLADKLAKSTALVILDNCEHLLDGSAALTETLLQRCPGVRILATSREPLGVEGETTYRIPSLGLPSGADDASCESVSLFTDRAALARPTMRVGAEELAAITEICTRLDGIPLAIELAAARCRGLTPTQIAERLRDHLGLLTGGSRRTLPRHRALEASIEWSYGLLTEDERVLLQRLSAFAGGFDLTAAEAVGADDSGDTWAVVDRLTGLVDKSLVLQDESGRYRLLETVRQFAESKLVSSGDATAVRRRHAEHFATIAAAAEDGLYGPDILAVRRRLRPDMDNLRAAVDFAVAAQDADLAFGILVPTDLYWQATAGEARERWSRALAVPGGTLDLRLRAYASAAEVECISGNFGQLAHFTTAGLALLDGTEQIGTRGWLTEQLGWVKFFTGEEGGIEAAEEGLALIRTGEGPRFRYYTLDALWGISMSILAEGRVEECLTRIDEAHELALANRAPIGLGRSIAIKGMCRIVSGEIVEARTLLAEANAILAECGDELTSLAEALGVYGDCLAAEPGALGRLRERLVHWRAGMEGFAIAWGSWGQSVLEARFDTPPAGWQAAVDEAAGWMPGAGFLWGGPWMESVRAQNLAAEGDLDGARTALAAAAATVGAVPRARLAAGVVELATARVALAAGDAAEAEDAGHRALATLASTGLRLQAVEALEFVAQQADPAHAAESARLFAAAAALRTALAYPPAEAEAARNAAGIGRVRKLLDPAAYDAAAAEGAAMSLADAAAYAARGRGPRRRPATGWNSLTPTELEVVGLVSAGLSNPGIAAKLFVSPETVKTHVSNVLAKLGVANRTELAALAARRI